MKEIEELKNYKNWQKILKYSQLCLQRPSLYKYCFFEVKLKGKIKKKNNYDDHNNPQMLRAQENYKTSLERHVLEDLNDALAKKLYRQAYSLWISSKKNTKDNDEGDAVVEETQAYTKPLSGAVLAVLYEEVSIL